MANKKKISKENILEFYMDYVLENSKQPSSVHSFTKANKMEEAEFYKFFGSFEAIEKSIFQVFFDNSIYVLQKSEDFKTFDARNKLLSFYFTFFEILTANRSYVVFQLNANKNKLKQLATLSDLKHSFTNFVGALDIETIDLKQKNIEKFQNKTIKETAWIQLLITIKFWLDDTSASFEKTDVFIEKSVNTSFDLVNTKPLESLIDLGKFLFKEKMNLKV
jgi:hypothetical protein